MGSRPEINQFILKMTEANTNRLSKLNKNKNIFNEAYGPFALCNRKLVNNFEQDEAQLKAYIELIQYVAKVRLQEFKSNYKYDNFCFLLEKIIRKKQANYP